MSQPNVSWKPSRRILRDLLSEGLVDEFDMFSVRGRDRRSSGCYGLTRRDEVVFSGARDIFRLAGCW